MRSFDPVPCYPWMQELDPRAKVLTGLVFILVVSVCSRIETLLFALTLSFIVCVAAGVPGRVALRRVLALNVFLLMMLPFLALDISGGVFPPFVLNREGLWLGLGIILRSNALLLIYTVWLSSIEASLLGHALARLKVPRKLINIYLMVIRYLSLIEDELNRLSCASRVRGFAPGMNRHTYRTLACVAGSLFVRSFDRAERILGAMRCRGFNGQYYLLRQFQYARRDLFLAAIVFAVVICLVGFEWAATTSSLNLIT